MPEETLLEVRDLRKSFPIRKGLLRRVAAEVKAVDGVDLTIARGETVGLVGESGCGKTTAGRSILHLTRPTGGRVSLRTAIHAKGGPAELFDVTRATPQQLTQVSSEYTRTDESSRSKPLWCRGGSLGLPQ